MSHVDEGTLHALVDGALDAEERREVEAHLASCGDCARQFAEATAMARQVTTLLGALDDVGGTVRIVAPVTAPVVAKVPERVTPVTPIRRTMFTMRRVAIAASVLLVAGVSYEVGQRGERSQAASMVPVVAKSPAKAAPMIATPSVVDAPSDSYVAAPASLLRQQARGGPRQDAEAAMTDRSDNAARKSSADAVAALAPPPPRAIAQPMAGIVSAPPRTSASERRRDVQAPSAAEAPLARGQVQEQARVQQSAAPAAQQTAPSADRAETVRQSQASSRFGSAIASGAAAPVTDQTTNGAAVPAKPAAKKAIPLAGYTTTEEESLPTITRRRYVSSSGTPLLLLITQPFPESKGQRSQEGASEFVVSTTNGRSTVRWHARGLDYELQAALAPDSLMKLATQLK